MATARVRSASPDISSTAARICLRYLSESLATPSGVWILVHRFSTSSGAPLV